MKITTTFTGSDEQAARYAAMDGKVRGLLREAIESLAIRLQTKVKRDKLSGNPLKRVTGDLSRSVNYKFIDGGMAAQVGANTPYAARQEYGFSGTESVRSFVRRSRAQMTTAKFNKLGLETRPSKAKSKGTGEVVVRAFSRHVNTPARSYLRSSLDEMRGTIKAKIQAAIMQGLR